MAGMWAPSWVHAIFVGVTSMDVPTWFRCVQSVVDAGRSHHAVVAGTITESLTSSELLVPCKDCNSILAGFFGFCKSRGRLAGKHHACSLAQAVSTVDEMLLKKVSYPFIRGGCPILDLRHAL